MQKYTKKEQRDIEGYGDLTGPPELTRGKRAIGSKMKRESKRKSKR